MKFPWRRDTSKEFPWLESPQAHQETWSTWVTCLLCKTRRLQPAGYLSSPCPTCGHVAPSLCDKDTCVHLQCVIIHLTTTLDAVRARLDAVERERR